eukprot:TRINITY_DN2599_c0_g1_i7.p1 TRINITY_DN2599_c0_g1~~TRINITY_DN2599_c0_g1_i7.p1  ORF type:complete len:622 (+),score=141.23 TRINITY_DN2599_c0_g1_i7:1-1866(+)
MCIRDRYMGFQGGTLNTCYNCLDRHIEELGDNLALIYDSPITKNRATFTYNEVLENVSQLAGVLVDMGIQKGDRVIIYMPMIPQTVFALLACARIGAIHSVVFGGFAPKELASRITDAKPKLIIAASCGIEPPKRIIDYKKSLDEAIKLSGDDEVKVLLFQRSEHISVTLIKGKHFDYEEMLAQAKSVPCVEVDATHPLYILYTSGTTGTPKGICRDNGGNAVSLTWTMKNVFNIGKRDVFFSGSDIGWVVGHSFIVYGPLMVGATTIIFEGKPVGTPDPGVYWRVIEEYKVKSFYTSPTALRAIKKEDPEGEYFKKYDFSSLDNIGVVGERSDIPTLEWLKSNIHEKVFINDTYWQTETGWPISCNYAYLKRFPEKFGSCVKPAPGYIVHILSDLGEILDANVLGNVCIKLPLPPSGLLTLYNHDDAYVSKYLKEHPGYYTTGDAGYFDENGYLHIMARVDDVINTAGHRLSTAQIEEVLNGHSAIAESAVVALKDDLRGEVPIGFVVVKKGHDMNNDLLEQELIKKVRDDVGPVAFFKKCIVVPKLPKTRSGKILRGVLKKIADGEEYKAPSTIEDDSVLSEITQIVKEVGLGIKANIQYEEDLMPQKKLKVGTDDSEY